MLPIIASLTQTAYSHPVTALSAYDGSVYAGRADGGVDRLAKDLSVRAVLAQPGGSRISFIAASPYGVAWLSGPGGVIREKVAPGVPAPQYLTIQAGDRTVSVRIAPSQPVRRLSWLAGRIAVCYDLGSAFFDARGKATSASAFMPADAAQLARDSALWVREQTDGTELALFAKPYAVRQNVANQKAPLVSMFSAYQVGAWQWAKLGGFASNALDAFPDGELKITEEGRLAGDTKFMVLSERVGLAADGVVAREPEAIATVPIYERNWEIARVTAPAVPGDALWFGASQSHVWWWNGISLVGQSRGAKEYSAFLPWNVRDLRPSAFVAEGDRLWIGSNRGIESISFASEIDGASSSWLRVPFGNEATSTADPKSKPLTDAVFAWRFADAEKAGSDGGIMIASIFSVLGLQLPQTAADLAASGVPVRDELRFGDLLATPRSVAFYLGNGITVEVRNGRVQNGAIWDLAHPEVRRVLPPH